MRTIVTIAAVIAGLCAVLLQNYAYEVHYIGFGGTDASAVEPLRTYFKACILAVAMLWLFRPTLVGAAAISALCLLGPGLYALLSAPNGVALTYNSSLPARYFLTSTAPLALMLLTTWLLQLRRKFANPH